MRGSGNGGGGGTPVQPAPWMGAGAERVAKPRWLESASHELGPTPFDVGSEPGSSILPPTFEERPFDDASAKLEESLQAAMAAAAREPLDDAPRAPATPSRDYEGELAAMAAEIEALRAELVAMATSGERIRRHVLESCEADVAELATVLAERIVDRELRTDKTLVANWAQKALAALADQSDLVIVVSPDVHDAVPRDAWRDADGRPIVPRVDPKLPAGSCDVQSKLSRIDGSASGRIRAVIESLGVTEPR